MGYRALITGVTGFVGGVLARHLLDRGDAVLGCSPDGSWESNSPEDLFDQVELVDWDLADEAPVPEQTRRRIEAFRPDCIYHLAAMSVPIDCGNNDPLPQATAVNVGGTQRVLRLARSLTGSPTPGPRILFTSSSHVYAPVSSRSPRVDETAPLGPRGGYGQTKLAAETEVRRAVECDGCDAVIARSFPHTGPRQDLPLILPQWASQFATGGLDPVKVHTCDAMIDLSDARDIVRAYRLLVERGRRGEVYNVGSGKSVRSGHLLEILRRMAEPDRPVVELHPGHKQDPIADISRLVQCTQWHAMIPLETTVADTLAWWRQVLAK